MTKISLETHWAQNFIQAEDLEKLLPLIKTKHQQLLTRKCPGHEFLGWLDLPTTTIQSDLITQMQQTATKIKHQSQVVIIIGIGGSYLGARAGIDFMHTAYYNQLPKTTPEIYFLGHHLSSSDTKALLQVIGERDFSLNVISKSGTTLEPALAFRLLKQKLEEKYGEKEAQQRIYITTDTQKGALRQLAQQYHYPSFIIPTDVGGRYSVLTAVGLLPFAIAGIDLSALLTGAQTAQQDLQNQSINNPAWQYALYRYLFYQQGKNLEVLASYEPQLHSLGKWWQQLFGESEGKNGQGLFPTVVDFTTDLHSLGQYLQEGKKQFFLTTLWVEEIDQQLKIPYWADNFDQLNYLQDQTLTQINHSAFAGTIKAHTEGGSPNLIIKIPQLDAWHLGYLFYFFQFSCALSALLLELNPFDQPGVEAYKRHMMTLLKK